MKASQVIAAGVVMGIALGAGLSLANFMHAPARLAPPSATQAPTLNGPGEEQPIAVVDRNFHDFGAVDRDRPVKHAFRISNVGKSVLTLKSGGTTCSKCTIAELSRSEVAPGETVDVIVEYLPTSAQPRFRQSASLLTNDPAQPRIELNIYGTVTAPYKLTPEQLTFSRFSASETNKAEIRVVAYVADDVKLASYELERADTAPFFEVASQPIPRAELDDPHARCGMLVTVTVKPGLPLGPVRQTIRLDLALAGSSDVAHVEIPVEGVVDADISVAGQGWNPDASLLKMGTVKSSEGAVRELFLLVRGEHRRGLTIAPGRRSPDWLKLTVGEPSELKGGAVVKIPLRIEIPPGAPVASHTGNDLGKYGEVVLETTHPVVKQIRMLLSFAVEQ